MKSGNYDELLDKFYAGTASAREISILKSEGLLDDQDNMYAEALKEERELEMDWEFEDLLKKVSPAKVVAFPGRSRWLKRMLVAAASVAIILSTYIFWPQQHQRNEIANISAAHKPIASNMEPGSENMLRTNGIKDKVQGADKLKNVSEKNMDYSEATTRPAPQKRIIKSGPKEKIQSKAEVEDYLVIVNGKPITDEAVALTITRASLSMVSQNLSSTVDELKPIGQIKIKL